MTPARYTLPLTCHSGTPSRTVYAVDTQVSWNEVGALAIDYVVRADLSRLRCPRSRPPRRVEGLWRHTCFEAFVSVNGSSSYYEFNFAPSGEWACYAFDKYREPGQLLENLAPMITARRAEKTLELDAVIPLTRLLPIELRAPLRLGLSAVLEERNGTLSYWALKHPPGNPDFHHPDAFVLEVKPWQGQATNANGLITNKR